MNNLMIGRVKLLEILPQEYNEKINNLYKPSKRVMSKSTVIKELGLDKDLAEAVNSYGNDSFEKYTTLLNKKRNEKSKVIKKLDKLESEISDLLEKVDKAVQELKKK